MTWRDDVKDVKSNIEKVRDKLGEVSERTIRTDTKVCNFVDKVYPEHQEEEKIFRHKNEKWHELADKKLNECPKEEQIMGHEDRIKEVENMANKASVWIWIFAALLVSGFGAVITFLLKMMFK